MRRRSLVLAIALLGVLAGSAWRVAHTFDVGAVRQRPAKPLPIYRDNPRHKNAYVRTDDPSIRVEDLGTRKWKIIDIHEHIEGFAQARMLLDAMDRFGIQRTCLMGSTLYTLTLNPIYGFEGFKENNEALLAIKKQWPERFCAFVTVNPVESGNLELLKEYVKRGADGLKLYVGHGGSTGKGEFHSMRIDDPRLEPLFSWAEQTQLPIVLHANLGKFWDELLILLERHPHLRLNLPHMGLQKNNESRLARLGFLLDRYPNVYTDLSFGYYPYQQEGFEVLGMNRGLIRTFLAAHRDKVMYASDMVIERSKDMSYVENTLRSYLQFLEQERWRFFLVPSRTMHGLGLDDDTLHHIYEVAPANFLLLDGRGRLPDRTKAQPVVGVPLPEPSPPNSPPDHNGAGRPETASDSNTPSCFTSPSEK